MRNTVMCTTLVTVLGLVAVVGCQPQPPAPDTTKQEAGEHNHDHEGHEHHGEGYAHGAGPHGGIIADWGGGKYHVEFVVDHDKQQATVYVLGNDEKTLTPVKTTEGTVLLTINEPAFQVTLTPEPLEGDPEGKASRYIGTHEHLGIVREFSGSIIAEVDGVPYAGDFKEEAHEEHDHK